MLTSVQIHHSMHDDRINAQTTLITLTFGDYLKLTEQSEDNLNIQRKVLSRRKFYERLRKDLRRGGTIPPIVLAVAETVDVPHGTDGVPLEDALARLTSEHIYVVDGLQRTHHMRMLVDELRESAPDELAAFETRRMRVELWTEIRFPSILYRMMLLNAAQTPMTLKHQLEVVSLHLVSVIKHHDPAMELFADKDRRRRYNAKQFQAADLVEGFTAFIKRTPLIDAKGIVLEELDQDDFMANFDEDRYNSDIATFVDVLGRVDDAICRKYEASVPGLAEESGISRGQHFLGAKPYLIGFCAAIGLAASRLDREEYVARADDLVARIGSPDADPLAFGRFHQLLPGVTQAAGRIGDAQREFVFNAFKKFFLDSPPPSFDECWVDAARRV